MADLKKHANNISTTLNGAITNVATTLTVNDATGMPSIAGSEYFALTITDGTNTEIVHVTDDTSSPTFTVTRAQEGTSNFAFADADTVELRVTADDVDRKQQDLDGLAVTSATVATGDKVLIQDADDSDNLKYVTAQSVADLKSVSQLDADLDANGFDIQFDNATGIRDDSDNEHLIFNKTASAVNYFEMQNAGTGVKPIFSVDGSDANVGMDVNMKGTGSLDIDAQYLELGYNTTGSGQIRLLEDGDNGTNYLAIKAPAAVTTSTTWTLPDGDGSAYTSLATNGSSALEFIENAALEVSLTADQTISASTITKIQFDDVIIDTLGDFDDTTNYRYTPTESGVYIFFLTVRMLSIATGKTVQFFIRKNGSNVASGELYVAGGNEQPTAPLIVSLNGSTDYIEAFIFHNDTVSRDLDDAPTFLRGYRIYKT